MSLIITTRPKNTCESSSSEYLEQTEPSGSKNDGKLEAIDTKSAKSYNIEEDPSERRNFFAAVGLISVQDINEKAKSDGAGEGSGCGQCDSRKRRGAAMSSTFFSVSPDKKKFNGVLSSDCCSNHLNEAPNSSQGTKHSEHLHHLSIHSSSDKKPASHEHEVISAIFQNGAMEAKHWDKINEDVQSLIKEQEGRSKIRKRTTCKVKLFQKVFSSNDICCVCGLRQNVLKCFACQKLYHLHCVSPPLKHLPPGPWRCCSETKISNSNSSEQTNDCPA